MPWIPLRELQGVLEREQLLARELQHRMKNLFSVVGGLISVSQREARAAGTPEKTGDVLRGKLEALARASEAIYSPGAILGHDDSVAVEAVVNSMLLPYCGRYAASGPPSQVPQRAMTTVVLFLHELATNSMKYGALSVPAGSISLEVLRQGFHPPRVEEIDGPPIKEPATRGFGTEMLDRMVQSTGGSIDRHWAIDGLVARAQFLTAR